MIGINLLNKTIEGQNIINTELILKFKRLQRKIKK